MIKSILSKFQLFYILYGNTLRLFGRHWFKFLFIACLFFYPLFLLDDWLYLNIRYLSSLHLYSLLDKSLYIVTFIFSVIYLILLYGVCICSDQDKTVKWGTLLKDVKRFFCSFSFIQILYLLTIILWSLALIIPGVFSAFLYIFSGLALLVDGKKGKEALKYSKLLVASRLNTFFDMLVLIIIVQGMLFVPFYLLINQAHRILYISSQYLLSTSVDSLFFLIALISMVIVQIFLYYLYLELKKKVVFMESSNLKEGSNERD